MNIISLSTIPSRFSMIQTTLDSLLHQTADIDRIILYIPKTYRRFPDYDGSLPSVPEGVDIEIVEQDLGPATKVLPAARTYQGQDVNILFCDDDRIYEPRWAATLLEEAEEHPGCAIAVSFLPVDEYAPMHAKNPEAVRKAKNYDLQYRLKRIWSQLDVFGLYTSPYKPPRMLTKTSGYVNIFEGFSGVLVRPEFFDDLAFDIPAKIWAVDDVWLSGHLERLSIPIWATCKIKTSAEATATQVSALSSATLDGLRRHDANRACIKYFQETYSIWT